MVRSVERTQGSCFTNSSFSPFAYCPPTGLSGQFWNCACFSRGRRLLPLPVTFRDRSHGTLIMDDLDELVLSLAERESRKEMIVTLSGKGDAAESHARRFKRRTGPEGAKREEAVDRLPRIVRILYFLRYGTDSNGATDADIALCTKIKERLTARGVWAPPEKH